MSSPSPALALLPLLASCYDGSGWGGSGQPDAGTALSDLPCEVASVLAEHCIRCHRGGSLSASATALTSHAALTAPAPGRPGLTVMELALERIADPGRPMPPPPAALPSSGAISALQEWVAAGYPPGTCGDLPDAGPDPYDTPLVCTTDRYWRNGNEESPKMHPGRACIACHRREGEGPRYDVAGTLYPTAHEFDDCYGQPGQAVIVITGADGHETTVVPNSAGNFGERDSAIVMPYRARVIREGRERVMSTPQTSGDCNSCHTEDGDDRAPGRIMLP